MNYEIKSAKEASLEEIFYDKNTNKLSYKDKLGIIGFSAALAEPKRLRLSKKLFSGTCC